MTLEGNPPGPCCGDSLLETVTGFLRLWSGSTWCGSQKAGVVRDAGACHASVALCAHWQGCSHSHGSETRIADVGLCPASGYSIGCIISFPPQASGTSTARHPVTPTKPCCSLFLIATSMMRCILRMTKVTRVQMLNLELKSSTFSLCLRLPRKGRMLLSRNGEALHTGCNIHPVKSESSLISM